MARGPLAGAAGPGKYSRRTDGGPGDTRQAAQSIPSASYGDGVDTMAIQTAAPLAATGGAAGTQLREQPAQAPQAPLTSLFAPSQRTDEPITTGIDMGPGAGSTALGMSQGNVGEKLSDVLARMLPYDQTGEVGILYQQALARGM